METKYILHGGYTSEVNDLNKGYFREMVDAIPEGGTILVVYFAAAEVKVSEKFNRDMKRFESHADTKEIHVRCATKENFIEEIKQSDVIYIRGGDTQKLKLTLDRYPEFVNAIKGKVVSGSSAGAYILSSFYFTNTESVVKDGYGCVPIRTVCHYKSNKHPVAGDVDPVLEMEKFNNKLELVLLKDYEWKIFNISTL